MQTKHPAAEVRAEDIARNGPFLLREAARYNTLLARARTSLVHVAAAVQEQAEMTAELEAVPALHKGL